MVFGCTWCIPLDLIKSLSMLRPCAAVLSPICRVFIQEVGKISNIPERPKLCLLLSVHFLLPQPQLRSCNWEIITAFRCFSSVWFLVARRRGCLKGEIEPEKLLGFRHLRWSDRRGFDVSFMIFFPSFVRFWPKFWAVSDARWKPFKVNKVTSQKLLVLVSKTHKSNHLRITKTPTSSFHFLTKQTSLTSQCACLCSWCCCRKKRKRTN